MFLLYVNTENNFYKLYFPQRPIKTTCLLYGVGAKSHYLSGFHMLLALPDNIRQTEASFETPDGTTL